MPPMPPYAPQPPVKKPRTNLIIIGAAAAVIAAIVGTGIFVVHSRDDSKPAATAKSAPADTATAVRAPDPTPTYADVDAGSFLIGLKTTSKQCFGSAGCNVTVEPDLTLAIDSSLVDPDAVYDITYTIHGDESGPVIETAELSSGTGLSYTPSVISTASSGTKVTVEITDVTQEG